MTAWNDLLSVALVGTERRPMPPALAGDVAAALGVDLPSASNELSVLAAAGVLATYRRAGWTPPHHDGTPAPAPPDDRVLASPVATQLLELLLGGQVAVPGGAVYLVADWLERSAACGRRPPVRLLPSLLATATADRSLRAATIGAGGPRLRWLAGRNPDWTWAAGPELDTSEGGGTDIAAAWATSERDTRMRLFATLRTTRPDDARRLVEETWSSEDARDRAAIVAGLAASLGPADEAFLEAALDDRSKVVRQAAAELLVRLPSSLLAQRMTDRLRPLVSVGGRLRKKLELSFPDEPDAAARRDGIVDTGAPPHTGPRAWWLTQIVAATPLRFWEEHLGLEPITIVHLAGSREVRHGLVLATHRQRETRWASALLPHQPDPTLLALLPPAEAEASLGPVLASIEDSLVPAALDAIATPWTSATSAVAVARLRTAKTTAPLQHAMPVLARRVHPESVTDIERWIAELRDDDHARRHVRGLVHALSIRQTIAQELT